LAAAATVIAMATALLTSAPASAATGTPVLNINEVMNPGTELVSPNGTMHLMMQSDGNLVLYAPGMSARWSTGTSGHPGAWAQFNPDGNFVVYGPGAVPLWSTMGSGGGLQGGQFLQVQDDGNLVQYTANIGVAWTSNTQYFPAATGVQRAFSVGDGLQSTDGRYTLKVEQMSVVFYGPNGQWIWKTPSNGYPITQFVAQADGNLVVYTTNGVAWEAERGGTGGNLFQVQTDGNVVFYAPGPKATWDSNSALARLVTPGPAAPPPSPNAAPVTPWNCGNPWGASCLAFSNFNPGTTWWGQSMCGNPTGYNCTNYVAYRLAMRGVQDFAYACGHPWVPNARGWDDNAKACGLRVDTTPAAGSVIVWEAYAPVPWGGTLAQYGHVAYIDAVSGSTLYVSQASCSAQAGGRVTLTWPISGVDAGLVHIIHV
jgi:surface antigen